MNTHPLLSEIDGRADTTPQQPLGASAADVSPPCGPSCGYRERLLNAIADAPPRRHELEVLLLYLDRGH